MNCDFLSDGARRLRFSLLMIILTIALPSSPQMATGQQQGTSASKLNLATILEQEYEVISADGRKIRLSQLIEKDKPALINFWATWCGPCRLETPHLVGIARKYKKQGLVVIGLTIENHSEAAEQVKAFARKYKVNYQLAYAPMDLFSEFNDHSARIAIPQTFIFSPQGKLVRRVMGYNPKLAPYVLIEGVEKALEKQPGAAVDSGAR